VQSLLLQQCALPRHEPLHQRLPAGQAQLWSWQVCPPPQSGSPQHWEGLMHSPLQSTCEPVHWQLLLTQLLPPLHSVERQH